MDAERERRSKALDATSDSNSEKYSQAANAYFDQAGKFYDKIEAQSATAHINRMKGWWVRLGVPMAPRFIVYGLIFDEGELEPRMARAEVKPSEAKEAVVTLDYTDPVECKYHGTGNPYAK